MTDGQICSELSRIKSNFRISGDRAAAREALQNVFDICFLRALCDEAYTEIIEKAFSVLRETENSVMPQGFNKYRFDAVSAVENLCFGADVLSFDKDQGVIFHSFNNTIYICADMKGFLFSVSNLIANAIKYSVSGDVSVTLKIYGKNVYLFITDEGEFSYSGFQKAMLRQSSLGFAVRFFESVGGGIALSSSNGSTTLALRLPQADKNLPVKPSPTAEELLYDRLSVIYIAFSGH